MKPITKKGNKQVLRLAPTSFAAFGKGVQLVNGLFYAKTKHIFQLTSFSKTYTTHFVC